jgi:hypothetical protein
MTRASLMAELSDYLAQRPEVIDVPYVCEAWTAT